MHSGIAPAREPDAGGKERKGKNAQLKKGFEHTVCQ
jgi:hypothetical protein